jgi:beta-glucosidase
VERQERNAMKFPNGFLWGTAAAAHQVEGDNTNSDCWVLEHIEGTIFAESSGDACDHYHRYRDDMALLRSLGFNSYRFSIEWARVEPERGEFSVAQLDHYRRMLAACHEHGLVPCLTMHHFTSPRWLAARGGWESRETAEHFARYCERVVRHMGDLIGLACTINELNIPMILHHRGVIPPDDKAVRSRWRVMCARAFGVDPENFSAYPFCIRTTYRDVMIEAHRLGADALRSGRGKFPVGATISLADNQAVPGGEKTRDLAQREAEDIFLEAARGDDFVGVQTYTRNRFGPQGPLPPEPGIELTPMGYEFWPEALEASIRHASAVARVPVYVTENGISADDDSRRIAYVERALAGVTRCIRDGIDVRGYYYWSMLDNFEWLFGYRQKFGLIGVDRSTQRRIVKPSAEWLGKIARANEI